MLNNWKKNPFDIQTNNCEMCFTLKRNAVYYFSEMLCPALVTSALTIISVLFNLSSAQLALLAFSILSQLLSLNLLNLRMPNFTDTMPTICK